MKQSDLTEELSLDFTKALELTKALEKAIKMSKQLEENQKIIGKELADLRKDKWILEKKNKELEEEIKQWKSIALKPKK